MEGQILQIHVVELFLNTVLYHRRIYPDGIYRRRRAYNTFSYITIFPPLMEYFRKILQTCQDLIETRTLAAVEINLISDGDVIESHELKMNQLESGKDKLNPLDLEERMKELLLRLDSKLKPLRPLPENTTFRVDLQTTSGALQKINNDCRFQDFPWIKKNQRHANLLYNPVHLDDKLGVDISINQKLDFLLP